MNRMKKRQEQEWEREDNKKDNQLQFVRNADNKKQIAEKIQYKNKEMTKEDLRKKMEI